MSVETFTYLNSLVASNPPATDGMVQADDHMRGIKAVLLATFPNMGGAVTTTHTQLNNLGTGNIQFADGTSGAPSISFVSEPTLGFYKVVGGIASFTGRLWGDGTCPTGMVADFLSHTVGPGWYQANGQAVPRTGVTASLFALIGTQYGAGNGSTTFNLPDLTDRYRRSGGTFSIGDMLADSIKTHTVDVSVAGADHNHGGGTAAVVNHVHTFATVRGILNGGGGGGTNSAVLNTTDGANAGLLTDPAGAQSAAVTLPNSGSLSMTGSGSYAGAVETRPLTFVVTTYIKS